MYLMETLDRVEMCGLLKGDASTTDKLERFGYVEIQILKDCILGPAGTVIPANEFHKSRVENTAEPMFEVKRAFGDESWTCGYRRKNVLGYYQHINLAGKRNLLEQMLQRILDRIRNGGGEDVH